MFALSVATETVSVDKISFMYIFKTSISNVFTRSVATATVTIVDTMEFGQPFKNHHFNMFALSVATATVSVDTIFLFFLFSLTSLSRLFHSCRDEPISR